MVLFLVSICDMEGEKTSGDQGQVPSSREGTPENWRQIYSQYLEDSPNQPKRIPQKTRQSGPKVQEGSGQSTAYTEEGRCFLRPMQHR